MDEHRPTDGASEFSIVLGGPLYQLWRRTRIAHPPLGLLHRRLIAFAVISWLPLLMLSAAGGSLTDGGSGIPFLYDIESHVRFLIALPVLIAAELLVHARLRIAVQQFLDRGIIRPDQQPKFQAAMDSVLRVRNSIVVEVALILFVFTVGHWVWLSGIALKSATWYAAPGGNGLTLSPAGFWYAFVSVPIFQFVLLRWYMRLGLWFWFLWRVSKLDLHLIPSHPDRAGGIGFLGISAHAFAPVLFAQAAVLSGMLANRILLEGQHLDIFKFDAVLLIGLVIVVILVPLTMFSPALARARQEGLRKYGNLATQYVQQFEAKWIGSDKPDRAQDLLGSGDIQSLADLGSSYGAVRSMRIVPFNVETVVGLVCVTVAPVLPLLLTVVPFEEAARRLINVIL